MPIDASIPLQGKGLQLESPMNQLAMMSDAMKIGEMQRGLGVQNELRKAIGEGVDVSTPEGFKRLASIDPTAAIKFRTQGLEGRKLQSEVDTSEYNLKNTKINTAITRLANLHTSQEAAASIAEQVQSGDIPPERGQQLMRELQSMPFQQFKTSQLTGILSAKDNLSNQLTKRGQDISANTAIRGQDMTDARAREGQRLQYDPTVQANIAESKKIGEARAEGVIAPAKDARANLKALKTAGYDPITGADNVSDLIKKSTSGAVETGLAGAYGAMPGAGATKGQEAIGKLASISKTLTLDLLDGKLGAGISNDDRTALEQRFGDMANSMIPSDKRLAAWGEAKEIMRRAAMLPEPGATPTPASKATKSGATVSNW
jgi:hypothetical protein